MCRNLLVNVSNASKNPAQNASVDIKYKMTAVLQSSIVSIVKFVLLIIFYLKGIVFHAKLIIAYNALRSVAKSVCSAVLDFM